MSAFERTLKSHLVSYRIERCTDNNWHVDDAIEQMGSSLYVMIKPPNVRRNIVNQNTHVRVD